MATERSSPARRPGASKPPVFADAPVSPQTDSPFAPTSNPTSPAIPTLAPLPARPVAAGLAPGAAPVALEPASAMPTQSVPNVPPPVLPPPQTNTASASTSLLPPPLPMTSAPAVPAMAPPLPLTDAAATPQTAPAPARSKPAKTKPAKAKRRGRRGGQGEAVAPQAAPVDPALLAAFRQFSGDVRRSETDGVYFPDQPTPEVAEEPKGPQRRQHEDLMPRGRGRRPSTGKGRYVLAAVGAIGLGAAFAVVLASNKSTPAPATPGHAVHVDATAATANTSITVPVSATRGPAYTLIVPQGFIADAGNDVGSDVQLSEPVLDLHLRVQSRTTGAVKIPTGAAASVVIAGTPAKGSETSAQDHAVRTVQFVRGGVTYTVTETVPDNGKAHTFKVLDRVLSGWSFQS